MDPVDLLEKRIAKLERQVLPKNYIHPEKPEEITDLLAATQTMINSALSFRDAINSILNHMTQINDYLNPANGEDELTIEAKRLYLLEVYPEIKQTIQSVVTFDKLVPYANSESILKIVDKSDRLKGCLVKTLQAYEESQKVTKKTLEMLQKYFDILQSIKDLLAHLDLELSGIEMALVPQPPPEE